VISGIETGMQLLQAFGPRYRKPKRSMHERHDGVQGNMNISDSILDLGTKWGLVVHATAALPLVLFG